MIANQIFSAKVMGNRFSTFLGTMSSDGFHG